MEDEEPTRQDIEWDDLYGRIVAVMAEFGIEDAFGKGDYLIVDDNYGWERHTVEVHSLRMLEPRIVAALRALLDNYPDWDIVVLVDVPGTEGIWPPMGLTIRKHEIIDGLLRQYLPREFAELRYEGSRPGTGYD